MNETKNSGIGCLRDMVLFWYLPNYSIQNPNALYMYQLSIFDNVQCFLNPLFFKTASILFYWRSFFFRGCISLHMFWHRVGGVLKYFLSISSSSNSLWISLMASPRLKFTYNGDYEKVYVLFGCEFIISKSVSLLCFRMLAS